MQYASKPRRRSRAFAATLAALLVALAVLLAYRGWSFYSLGLHERPDHPEFKLLRPSGLVGNGYGFAAAVLIATNLLYLARRRIPRFRLGSMRFWLDLHVFTGLTAAMLVGFHSAFQLRSPLATITAASLAVVVVTGIVGRLFHALVPEDGGGELAMALDAVGGEAPAIRAELDRVLAELPAPGLRAGASLLRCLAVLPRWRSVGRRRRGAIRAAFAPALRAAPDRRARRVLRSLRRWVTGASRREVRSAAGTALLRSWRSLHRLFAITMLVAVGVHVGVAWHFGYRWVFQ
ncbi:MAG TPA: hypothetical protein VFU21_00690 [Kofleriaceae bacterium]|nr:hypothetical protein [Kofleriaceae bacterium]